MFLGLTSDFRLTRSMCHLGVLSFLILTFLDAYELDNVLKLKVVQKVRITSVHFLSLKNHGL